MEDSAVAWKNYLYVADNGGKLFCWDLNTMKLVWVQNVLDDTNTSPVFAEEDGHGYIYISTSLHITATGTAAGRKGGIPIWKIDAATGEIVWKTEPYKCYTVLGVSGGVQDTPVLGQKDIANLVIYAIARTPNPGSGILVALDRKTGEEVWSTSYQPLHVEFAGGRLHARGQVLHRARATPSGNMFLLEGKTGKIVDYINLGTNIEASPAVFDNTIVVGTRGQKIYAQDQLTHVRRGRHSRGTHGQAQDHRDRPRPLQRVRRLHHRLRRGRAGAGRRGQGRPGQGDLLRRHGHVPERLPHRRADGRRARKPGLRLPGHGRARRADPGRRGGRSRAPPGGRRGGRRGRRPARSELTQWPIQLHLISPAAPYFHGADLLVAADCTAFALGSFHSDLLKGRKMVIACPKLDETGPYLDKLAALIRDAGLKSLTIAIMTVPCCTGLERMVRAGGGRFRGRHPREDGGHRHRRADSRRALSARPDVRGEPQDQTLHARGHLLRPVHGHARQHRGEPRPAHHPARAERRASANCSGSSTPSPCCWPPSCSPAAPWATSTAASGPSCRARHLHRGLAALRPLAHASRSSSGHGRCRGWAPPS